MLYLYDSIFKDNYSFAKGSVILADFKNTYMYAFNCSFVDNFGENGGVFFTHFNSCLEFEACIFDGNKGMLGGIGRVEN